MNAGVNKVKILDYVLTKIVCPHCKQEVSVEYAEGAPYPIISEHKVIGCDVVICSFSYSSIEANCLIGATMIITAEEIKEEPKWNYIDAPLVERLVYNYIKETTTLTGCEFQNLIIKFFAGVKKRNLSFRHTTPLQWKSMWFEFLNEEKAKGNRL